MCEKPLQEQQTHDMCRRHTKPTLPTGAHSFSGCAGRVCRGFLPRAPFPNPRNFTSHKAGFHPPFSGVVLPECRLCSYTSQAGLHQSRNAGQVAARGLSLADSIVTLGWPRKEHTGLLPVVRFLASFFGIRQSGSGHLWHRSGTSWPPMRSGTKVQRGLRLGHMDTVVVADIFQPQLGP